MSTYLLMSACADPATQHSDARCSTFSQHPVFRNGWTTPVELVASKLRQCDTLGELKRLLRQFGCSETTALYNIFS